MPFEPLTNLYFYKNTKVDAQNHPYFTSRMTQFAWYQGFLYTSFSSASYQREGNAVRVPMIAEDLRQCDMLCFCNTNYPTQDVYEFCRITYVEFVNPNTSLVHFVVDSWETYGTQITIPTCYVEREMVENDWNGNIPGWQSLTDEGISPGPQVVSSKYEYRTDQLMPVMLSAYDETAEVNSSVTWETEVPTTLNQIVITSKSQMDSILDQYAEKGRLDGVAGIFMVPSEYANSPRYDEALLMSVPESIDGYKPKNSKVYSSEFCFVEITNLQGQSVKLKPELFEAFELSGNLSFQLHGTFANGNGGFMLLPAAYAGLLYAYDEAVTLFNNVQCAWAGDSFKNWMANNRGSMIAKQINNIVGGVQEAKQGAAQGLVSSGGNALGAVLGATEGISGALQNVAGTAISQLGTIIDRSANRYNIQSLEYGNSIMAAINMWGFDMRFWTPTAQMAAVIDDYFNRFGYKIGRLKVPNLNTRPYWNYVQTVGCTIAGGAPRANLDEIQRMFDAGVTFWNVTGGATIGDYTQDNRQ